MPLLNISTNVNLDGVDTTAIISEANSSVAKILGRPEEYMMGVLKGSVAIVMEGNVEPAACGELITISNLDPQINSKLSAAIAHVLHTKLSIPKSRCYIIFRRVEGAYFGYDGSIC